MSIVAGCARGNILVAGDLKALHALVRAVDDYIDAVTHGEELAVQGGLFKRMCDARKPIKIETGN